MYALSRVSLGNMPKDVRLLRVSSGNFLKDVRLLRVSFGNLPKDVTSLLVSFGKKPKDTVVSLPFIRFAAFKGCCPALSCDLGDPSGLEQLVEMVWKAFEGSRPVRIER